MLSIIQTMKRNTDVVIEILPLLSFIIPISILWYLDPNSFQTTWKGRTYYLLFLWLVCLELILDWGKLTSKISRLRSIRTVALATTLLLPTIYVIAANYWGLNNVLLDIGTQHNVYSVLWIPLSTEYLVLTGLFVLVILLEYGKTGLMDFSISAIFLGLIGSIYMIDTIYPYGRFAPFQIFVPTTATLGANILNLMGYRTSLSFGQSSEYGSLTYLAAWDPKDPVSRSAYFAIAWPCAGVESLLIYTATILLFLKRTPISIKQKIAYFIIGAIVTYFINILRLATVFSIKINNGDWRTFHDFYGQLYSITWIILYPLIIIGSQALLTKIRNSKMITKKPFDLFKIISK